MSDFIHLHNHTHYSLQDGACTVEALVKAAKKNNMPAVALTDHGVMYGISEFYTKAKKEGIKPIVGMEAYIVKEGSRFDKGKHDDLPGRKRTKHYNHLILLAKDKQGYKNLSKLSTYGHTQGFYYRPRIDLELLRQYKDGLIAMSACAGGIVAADLVNNDYDKARATAITYKELFGDDFYLEIQDHNMDVERSILEGMPKLARELGIKLVATNDCHYIEKDHAIAHNILLLLGDKTGTADYHQLRYNTDQIYFKSSDEMKQLFSKYPESIETTLEIAEKTNVNLDFEGHLHPIFPIPPESHCETLDDYFELIAREGLQKRFRTVTSEIQDRFDYELATIKKMGFSGYFLIVQDFINASRRLGVPVGPGRGSAAGSLVAYTLGITNVDPLEYDLLFERFLNPARKSMPDIDVDFADSKRGMAIDYVRQKYGENSVSQIVTFNRLSSKAVIRDVARVLKIPIPTVNKITKFIPSKFGKVFTIDQALAEVPELKWVSESNDPQILELIKYARILEGMNRNASKHAAGVVITPGEVSDHVPLATPGGSSDLVTQYNMKELDHAGLLKMDFLGLRTLTIIADAIELIEKNYGIQINTDDIPVDDEKTFQLFAKGQTTAVFQFESGPMREYLKKLKPSSVKDLSAMNALYRPGPMEFIDDFIKRKHGMAQAEYLHPVLEPILSETYGIIVYQEQVIQIANKAAGMSLAEADILRRAMGKKDLQAMKEQKEIFVAGAVKNNIPKNTASEIFDAIDKFANYGFNKSHAVAYSVVAYHTAYLKAHYPAEFLAANMTNEFGNTGKITSFLEDCRKLKIEVLCPDVNNPSVYFDVKDGKIIFGMCAIKNVGINAVEEIKKSRERLGRDFTSIFDFCSNVETRIVNKRTIEGLILAGAFDRLKGTRAQNFAAVEMALDFGSKVQNSSLVKTESLFGDSPSEDTEIPEPELPDFEAWTSKEELSREREVLGFYLSDHPLRKYEVEYKSFATVFLGETESLEETDQVRACGVITGLKTKIDKSGKTMAFFTLDDFSGSCECLMFGSTYEKVGKYVGEEATVMVIGRPESSGDAIKLQIENVIPLEEAKNLFTKTIKLTLDDEKHKPEMISSLKKILEKNPGNLPVLISVQNNGCKPRNFFVRLCRVKISRDLSDELMNILGEESIMYCS
ncbi:MAG: DNA polymerase III subunit alpha [Bacteroidota bacterium]